MPRGPAPAWRARKPPVVDDWILASVNQAGGLGAHHPDTGHYADLVITEFTTKEEAIEWRQALFRCAHYLNRTGRAPVSMSAKVVKHGKKCTKKGCIFHVEFRAVDKTLARKHVLDRYGPDRSKWPYDPRRRQH